MHNCEIDEITIQDSDFEKQFDFYKSTFKSGIKKDEDDSTTSIDFNGFDLDRINFWNDSNINFYNLQGLDVSESIENTSQETYRIIKYHLDSIGNKIDANKYHSLELSKNRNNIWDKDEFNPDLLQRGITSFIHWITSNHSSYWIVSLIWICIVGSITSYNIDDSVSLDSTFKFMTIWSSIDNFCDNHIVYLLNKVSLGYLYYQFLTAVRKDTRK